MTILGSDVHFKSSDVTIQFLQCSVRCRNMVRMKKKVVCSGKINICHNSSALGAQFPFSFTKFYSVSISFSKFFLYGNKGFKLNYVEASTMLHNNLL